uniref:Phospholipase n=1 Tax=Ciona savignyi TaxID=51511 RepID=H2Z4U1_CIOSA
IPYMSIYGSPSRMIVGVGSAYLAKTPVKVKITNVKHDVTYRHPLNPNLYTIELSHGQFSWTIYRRYKHFIELHEKLWTYRATLKLPLPSKSLHCYGIFTLSTTAPLYYSTHWLRLSTTRVSLICIPNFNATKTHRHRRKRQTSSSVPKNESKIPRFPKTPEIWVSGEDLENRKEQLNLYLKSMLRSRMYRGHTATFEFFDLNFFSFKINARIQTTEGVINKRSGGHKISLDLCARCCNIHDIRIKWRTRWFVVKDTFLAYLDPTQDKIKGVLLFDAVLNVLHQAPSSKLVISNISRSLNVDCWTDRQAIDWKRAIEHSYNNLCDGLTSPDIRHSSFAPPREDCYAHWFVDGRSYFEAVADAIEAAREEVYITDWWLTPEIYMKRPITHGDYWRLDKLLKRKAAEGVKIYVQLYKEVEMAVGLDSAYTKRTLVDMHPTNIRVMRHPDLSPGETLLWAHHEKIVVVDQTVAFIGGIDLCYGRWDDQKHLLTDIGADCTEVRKYFVFFLLKFHRIVIQLLPISPRITNCNVLKTLAFSNLRNKQVDAPEDQGHVLNFHSIIPDKFLSYKQQHTTHHLQTLTFFRTEINKFIMFYIYIQLFPSYKHQPQVDATEEQGKPRVPSVQQTSTGLAFAMFGQMTVGLVEQVSKDQYKNLVNKVEHAAQAKLWIGKDYNNFILKDLSQLDDPFGDVMDRTKMPRMPWHDIACMTYGKPARDAARHFIQRWNYTKIQKAKKGEHISFLLPKSYADDAFNIPKDWIRPEAVRANVQVLRSSCEWSAGISEVDRSIQNAYLSAIEQQHFIYIENQFFISCLRDVQVRNQICTALVKRIVRAHRNKKAFRVYVVMPLLPGFEGDISGKSQAIRTVLHWQYKSINRGPSSLFEELNKEIGAGMAWRYISFCGLRTHSELMGKPITEIIYVHSKMMIVDDRLVIIGSANINDRSMSGTRDSEVAMLVEDTQFVDSIMAEQPFKVGVYASSLRRRCFAEHLGLLPDDYDGTMATFDPMTHENGIALQDVASESFFKEVWTKTSAVNTTVYEKVFCCVPSDYVRKLADIANFQRNPLVESDGEAATTVLQKIKGYLVLLPLLFLIDEDLTPDAMTKEAIAPTDLWT